MARWHKLFWQNTLCKKGFVDTLTVAALGVDALKYSQVNAGLVFNRQIWWMFAERPSEYSAGPGADLELPHRSWQLDGG